MGATMIRVCGIGDSLALVLDGPTVLEVEAYLSYPSVLSAFSGDLRLYLDHLAAAAFQLRDKRRAAIVVL